MNLTPGQKARLDICVHFFEDYGEIPKVIRLLNNEVQNNAPKFIEENKKMLEDGVLSAPIIEMRLDMLELLKATLEQMKKSAQ